MGRNEKLCSLCGEVNMNAQANQEKQTEKENGNHEVSKLQICIKILYRRYLEVFTVLHGLGGLFLLISGVCQLIQMRDDEIKESEDHNLSTCSNLCWMLIISGTFLLFWTLSGLIDYMRRSISLDTTCGVSNIIIIFLFYFIYCASPRHQEHHPQFNLRFMSMFCIILVTSIIHAMFILASMTITAEDKTGAKPLMEKPSEVRHKLTFTTEIYHVREK